MSRVEKAREEKKKGKKKTGMLLALVVLLALGAGAILLYGPGSDIFSATASDAIDSEKSFSRIDFFNQTFVYVYLDAAGDTDRVVAEGEQLAYNPDNGRWEAALSGYSAGDQVKITAYSDEKVTGEAVLTVEELPLDEE